MRRILTHLFCLTILLTPAALHAQDKGVLRITTEPGGARIFINGERVGSSPTQVGQSFAVEVPVGEHRVEAVLPGEGSYESFGIADDVFVSANTLQPLHIDLGLSRLSEDGRAARTPLVDNARRVGSLRAGDRFADCADCPEMVVIPAGSFTMGSPSNEVARQDREGPRREVRFARPFAMGVYEVTFAQWDSCAAAGYCTRGVDDRGWGRGARPVMNVSWDDVQAFLRWMNSQVDGNPYRLPSEAEWEYAARAGSNTAFWWGNRISPDQANYRGNEAYNNGTTGLNRRQTLPVGSFAANPFGLFDVHGNVWEWVQDCYGDGYAGAPRDGSARSSTGCTTRVRRGGSWVDVPRNLRSASRGSWNRPGDLSDHSSAIGFRLARTLTP
jgi:formylglycine-generating enzyme required for sulfatase activity